MTPALATAALPKEPYRGLKPFRYADRSIFFVRENETRTLVRLITVYRGVLFYGDSGTGKSSLINAGLVPAAMKYGLTPERVRIQPLLNQEFVIERLIEQDEEPLQFLPSLLTDNESSNRTVFSAEEFISRIQKISQERTLLLMLDQFEEWITLVDQNSEFTGLEEARKAQSRILDVVVQLLRNHSIPVKLLFVFREDYLAKLNRLFRQCPDIVDNYLRLTSPPTSSLRRIIRGPFDVAEPEHWNTEISDSVAVAIQKEIEERGHSTINLSEIQVVCLRLWESKQPEAIYATRKISGILEDFLETSLAELGPMQETAVALLSRMVTSSGTRNVVSQEDLIDRVKKEEGISRPNVEKALNALVEDTKLVSKELRNEIYFYEIVSEFLVPWIFQQKLKLASRAARTKLIKRIIFSALVVLLVVLALGYWYRQENTVQALQNRMVQQLTSRQNALEESQRQLVKLVDASADKEKFSRELNNQLKAAVAERDAALNQIKNAEATLEVAASKGASLQEANTQLSSQLEQAQKSLQQEESKRKQAESKAADLQAILDKSGGTQDQLPQASPDANDASKVSIAWATLSREIARRNFGETAERTYVFLEVVVSNLTEYSLEATAIVIEPLGTGESPGSFTANSPDLRMSILLGRLSHVELLWRPPELIRAQTSVRKIIPISRNALKGVTTFKAVRLEYEILKSIGHNTAISAPKESQQSGFVGPP